MCDGYITGVVMPNSRRISVHTCDAEVGNYLLSGRFDWDKINSHVLAWHRDQVLQWDRGNYTSTIPDPGGAREPTPDLFVSSIHSLGSGESAFTVCVALPPFQFRTFRGYERARNKLRYAIGVASTDRRCYRLVNHRCEVVAEGFSLSNDLRDGVVRRPYSYHMTRHYITVNVSPDHNLITFNVNGVEQQIRWNPGVRSSLDDWWPVVFVSNNDVKVEFL